MLFGMQIALFTIRAVSQGDAEGRATHRVTDEITYREYELVNVFRQFELADTVDQAKITADLKQGVLTLILPKAEAAKPRQIPVQVR
jgi:HSP20 family protein